MKQNIYGTMFTGAVLASSAVLISACSEKFEAMATVPVNIEYNEKGCPISVDKNDHFWKKFEIDESNHIIWQTTDPGADYTIYFDPFNKEPLKSVKGTVTSPEFKSTPPKVVYKYTIVDERCKKKPLDPRFRLR